jgi:uncharacterized integral membrane protein (TIGR00697 family)
MGCAYLINWIVVNSPPAAGWAKQDALFTVFSNPLRIILATIAAFFFGEFVNSLVLSKMKVVTKGRFLWIRTIGSTLVGQAVDSSIFYPLAFWGSDGWTTADVVRVMFMNTLLKISFETLLTPVTYLVTNRLKQIENLDVFDINESYSLLPFETGLTNRRDISPPG